MNIKTTLKLNNGVEIPMLGFGTFKAVAGEETENAVFAALKAGYTHIDTATVYGNEESVGIAIKRSGIDRKDIFVTTKCWNDDMRAGNQMQAFEDSLKRLGMDYVDLYLIHWPVENFSDSWKVFEEIYASGRARAIGVSNFHKHHLDKLMETANIVPAVNQFECHPYLACNELIDYCRQLGIAPEAYSPLGGRKSNIMQNETLQKLSAETGRTMAQLMLRWNLQRGIIVIPKSVKEHRIIENCDLYSFELNDEQMAVLDSFDRLHRFGSDPDNFSF